MSPVAPYGVVAPLAASRIVMLISALATAGSKIVAVPALEAAFADTSTVTTPPGGYVAPTVRRRSKNPMWKKRVIWWSRLPVVSLNQRTTLGSRFGSAAVLRSNENVPWDAVKLYGDGRRGVGPLDAWISPTPSGAGLPSRTRVTDQPTVIVSPGV